MICFAPENLDATVAALISTQPVAVPGAYTGSAKARRADAEQRLHQYQAAIGAGVDPVAMAEAINQAQAARAAAQAEIDNTPAFTTLDPAEVYAMIDALGDIGATIGDASLLAWHVCTGRWTSRYATNPPNGPST